MADVHIIGQLVGCMRSESVPVACQWSIVTGPSWHCTLGEDQGHTHVDTQLHRPEALWSHPIDVQYATGSVQGWPKFIFQVFSLDKLGRWHLYGYGCLQVPMAPGTHSLDCALWRPIGSWYDRLYSLVSGNTLQLRDPAVVHDAESRYRLKTIGVGSVHLSIQIVTRNMDHYGLMM